MRKEGSTEWRDSERTGVRLEACSGAVGIAQQSWPPFPRTPALLPPITKERSESERVGLGKMARQGVRASTQLILSSLPVENRMSSGRSLKWGENASLLEEGRSKSD